jgi:methionyl-tRNA formyltransferase
LFRYGATKVSERRGAPRSVAAIAARNGVPVRSLRTINDPDYLATVSTRGVDVLLSVSAPQIFTTETLPAARFALNVHTGKLPEYRGMMPTFWALANGDEHVTVTVHEMVQRLDAGPIVDAFDVRVERGIRSLASRRAQRRSPARESQVCSPTWTRRSARRGASQRRHPSLRIASRRVAT